MIGPGAFLIIHEVLPMQSGPTPESSAQSTRTTPDTGFFNQPPLSQTTRRRDVMNQQDNVLIPPIDTTGRSLRKTAPPPCSLWSSPTARPFRPWPERNTARFQTSDSPASFQADVRQRQRVTHPTPDSEPVDHTCSAAAISSQMMPPPSGGSIPPCYFCALQSC